MSIKYQNLHYFKEGMIRKSQSQSILKTRRISHLHGSAPFTILLSLPFSMFLLVVLFTINALA